MADQSAADERNLDVQDVRAARNDGKLHLLLCCSGSVATIKLPQIVTALSKHGSRSAPRPSTSTPTPATKTPRLSIRIILTQSASHFLQGQSAEQPNVARLRQIDSGVVDGVYYDHDEWGPALWTRGASILHIELRKWAHLMVIAPLSANTMAKICNGICDNLLTSVVRAWDTDASVDLGQEDGGFDKLVVARGYRAEPSIAGCSKKSPVKKRILVAPAMNTAMWRHPVTRKQISQLQNEWGVQNNGWFEVLSPGAKALACGDVGEGAMVEWNEIVRVVEQRLGLSEAEKARV